MSRGFRRAGSMDPLMKNKQFYHRLGFAASGVSEAWRRERSFGTPVLLARAAIVFTVVFAPGLIWAAAVALSIALVLTLELLNTAMECLIDHLHTETASALTFAKDIAAGSALMATVGAA